MSSFNTCKDTHQEIAFEGDTCPLCVSRQQLADVLDDRVDIDETNIFDLYKEIKTFNARLDGIEFFLGITVKKSRLPWRPLRYARTAKQPDSET